MPLCEFPMRDETIRARARTVERVPPGESALSACGLATQVLLELPESVEMLARPDQVEGRSHPRPVPARECCTDALDESATPLGVPNVRRRRRGAVHERVAEADVPGPQGMNLGIEIGCTGHERFVAVGHLGERRE